VSGWPVELLFKLTTPELTLKKQLAKSGRPANCHLTTADRFASSMDFRPSKARHLVGLFSPLLPILVSLCFVKDKPCFERFKACFEKFKV